MLTAAVIVGWVLVAFLGMLYWAALRQNVTNQNALEMFCLAVLLSDEYRKLNQERAKEMFDKYGGVLDQKTALYSAMTGLSEGARQMMNENLSIVLTETNVYFRSE